MTEILISPWFLSFFGWILFNFLMFNVYKDKFDKQGKELDYKKYLSKNWDNWLLTLLFIVPTALFAPDITKFLADHYGKTVGFYKFFYLGTGVLSEITIMAVKWFYSKFVK